MHNPEKEGQSYNNYKNNTPLVASHHSPHHHNLKDKQSPEMEGTRSYDREFDNLEATELRLGLPGTDDHEHKKPSHGIKRALEVANDGNRSEAEAARTPAK